MKKDKVSNRCEHWEVEAGQQQSVRPAQATERDPVSKNKQTETTTTPPKNNKGIFEVINLKEERKLHLFI